jgi:hypothetical protein
MTIQLDKLMAVVAVGVLSFAGRASAQSMHGTSYASAPGSSSAPATQSSQSTQAQQVQPKWVWPAPTGLSVSSLSQASISPDAFMGPPPAAFPSFDQGGNGLNGQPNNGLNGQPNNGLNGQPNNIYGVPNTGNFAPYYAPANGGYYVPGAGIFISPETVQAYMYGIPIYGTPYPANTSARGNLVPQSTSSLGASFMAQPIQTGGGIVPRPTVVHTGPR